ncbi:MAG: GNAT family N-acetyltransferase [Alphaproteobacteria bacterium]
MRCVRFGDAEAFWRHVEAPVTANVVENNVLVGVAGGLRRKPDDTAAMLAVEEEGRVWLAALMTPPYRMIVSTGEKRALPCLIDEIVAQGLTPPGVVGLTDMSEAFAGAWSRRTGARTMPAMRMTLYTLSEVTMPETPAGTLRKAAAVDIEHVAGWIAAFSEETLSSEFERKHSRETATAQMERSLVYLWEVDGVAVSTACYRDIGEHGARIGPVYTPPDERRKGYGTACVSHLSRRILALGKTWCSLFADATNPTSNNIYRRMGYNAACTYREYDFAAITDAG